MSVPSTSTEEPAAALMFAGSLSHELRAPLAAIHGYTQLLREELRDGLEAHQVVFFDTILASVEQSLDLVNELVDFSRIVGGRQELRLAPIALHALCDDVFVQVSLTAGQKGVAVHLDTGERPWYVTADVIRLRQVLLNLLHNAIKYTERGSVTLHVRPDPEGVAVEVVDTGRGIAPEFQPRLFERFSREERLTEAVQQGAGIGLAISLEYVHLMGGRIDVESAPGEGARFILVLPSADPSRW
jgi:signal transduction histidine kinase